MPYIQDEHNKDYENDVGSEEQMETDAAVLLQLVVRDEDGVALTLAVHEGAVVVGLAVLEAGSVDVLISVNEVSRIQYCRIMTLTITR